MVLFGSTGDLTHRKLLPALYSLTADGLLQCGLPIVCVGRRKPDRDALVADLRRGVEQFARRRPLNDDCWQELATRIHYVRGGLDDESTYRELGEVLKWAGTDCAPDLGRLFYLATPPEFFPTLLTNLKHHGLATDHAQGGGWSRVVIEKPFGADSQSARELNDLLRRLYSEDQIFRMDHYLGKETVQNLLVLRFANSVFEPIWNERHIHHIEITAAETAGMVGRGTYFDSAGITRDMIQNHVLQMLALVAIEPPVSMDPDDLDSERLKVFKSLCRLTPEEIDRRTVRGRYGPGKIGEEEVPGYLSEPDVAPDSRTETYAALRVCLNNWRWAGVPFYLRTGKRLARSATEIVVAFKSAPHLVFQGQKQGFEANRLVIRIQPNEGVRLSLSAKQPGPGITIQPVGLEFSYAEAFAHEPPEAYERLILDALLGDHTLFAEGEVVQAAWDFITPILERWASSGEPPVEYPAGSWGPKEADQLVTETGDQWHEPGT
jgi:glucose-6-phosphate 1-dehydrogenase